MDTTSIVNNVLGLIDPAQKVPNLLTTEDKRRHDNYLIDGLFYEPPTGTQGLYLEKTPDDTYLYKKIKWTIDPDVTHPWLPEFACAFFNPVPEIVDIDTAAMLNEFKFENMEVLQEKSGIISTTEGTTKKNNVDVKLTDFVHDVFRENDFNFLYQNLFGMRFAYGDAYQRVYLDAEEETENGVLLENYSPTIVYPVLSETHFRREAAFRIQWRAYAPDKVDAITERLGFKPTQEYREVITPMGSIFTIAGKEQGDPNIWPWPDTLSFMPFVHFGSSLTDYFGRPSCHRILDPINRINHLLSLYWYAGKQTGTCQVYYTGEQKIDKWLVGYNSKLYYLGKTGSMSAITFPIDGSYIQILQTLLETTKNNMPHYKVENRMEGKQAKRPETVAAMYGNFITYATMLQNSAIDPLKKVVNAILMMKEFISKKRRINIDMGSPVSEAIVSKLEGLNQKMDILQKAPDAAIAEYAISEMNVSDEQKELLKQSFEAQNKEKAEQKQREIESQEAQNAPNMLFKKALEKRKGKEAMTTNDESERAE